MQGYIKLYRKILDNKIWNKKPFSRGQAWVDLLLHANFTDDQTIIKNTVYQVKAGEQLRSMKTLAQTWGWNATAVRCFLDLLKNLNQIELKTNTQTTRISIINWDRYNESPTTTQPQPNRNPTATQYQPNTVKNIKNNNKDNIYRSTRHEIIKYLNEKTCKTYHSESTNSVRHINARLKEGYTVDQFKAVIDIKVEQWLHNPEYNKYLRPQTLFGTKFESYINEKPEKPKKLKSEVWP